MDRDHPILAAVCMIGAELDAAEHAPAWSLSDDDTRRALVELTRLEARVAAMQLKVAAHADRNRVGDASGATSAGVWWANHTRMTQRDSARKIKLAKALERHDAVGDALAAGDILLDQASAITHAVDVLRRQDLLHQARVSGGSSTRLDGARCRQFASYRAQASVSVDRTAPNCRHRAP
jgi:hypothetical protein